MAGRTLEVATELGKERLQYDLLIGADGVHSPVRSALAQQVCHLCTAVQGHLAISICYSELLPVKASSTAHNKSCMRLCSSWVAGLGMH